MTEPQNVVPAAASLEEIQKDWTDVLSRLDQLEARHAALEQENKALRLLLERTIVNRQKSHNELVLLLTDLVGKLPINDVGGVITRLVEHNKNLSEYLQALIKGTSGAAAPAPVILKHLDQIKRDIVSALKPVLQELIQLDVPLETGMLEALGRQPEQFFSPLVIRANRCFQKGNVPRERVVREFGEAALVFFNDMTTDSHRNPHPKADEIALSFKSEFDSLLQQAPGIAPDKLQGLAALHKKVQQSRAATEQSRAQKNAFQRLTFLCELLHFYEHQNTEGLDSIFAQRLPGVLEQLVLGGPQEGLDAKAIALAEGLLGFIANPDHRMMVVNNIGKGGGMARNLKFILRLRMEKAASAETDEVIAEFVKQLIPVKQAPAPGSLIALFRLLNPEMQRLLVKAVFNCERIRSEEAEALGKAVADALELKGVIEEAKARHGDAAVNERVVAWAKIKDLVANHGDPAAIATAIRQRLTIKYDADEIRQSWVVLTESDPMGFIRIFCQMPYLADGRTDPIARPVMETYVSRLTHEKYASIYQKVATSLKNMFRAKPDSPTLLNFMALMRWISPEAANRLCADIGMPVPAH